MSLGRCPMKMGYFASRTHDLAMDLSFFYVFFQSDELYWDPPIYSGEGGGVLTRTLPTIFPKNLRRIYSLSIISIHVKSTSCSSVKDYHIVGSRFDLDQFIINWLK